MLIVDSKSAESYSKWSSIPDIKKRYVKVNLKNNYREDFGN